MNKTTCQICARDIKANTGIIAHHGYQRPGNGWQTSSCMGARHLPYEQSRDLIPTVIEAYKGIRQNNIDREKDLLANPPATITKHALYGFQQAETYTKPANFEPAQATKQHSFRAGENDEMYKMEFSDMVRQCGKNVKSITAEIEWLQRRYDAWIAPEWQQHTSPNQLP